MTFNRIIGIFIGIALACFALAGIGHWLLGWTANGVHTWLSIGAGYFLACLVMLLMPRWWRDHCNEMYAQPAGRRYIRALFPIMAGYSLALYVSVTLIKRGIPSLPLRGLVAVLPALAIALLMRAALRYLREIDEMQRRIETEAIGIASLGVALLYFAGGMLQLAKVIAVDAGPAMIWVFPLLMLLYGISKLVLTRRYL
ncbi:hypothetical protein [Thermomonas sp.]|uniref:hypothetical protein n=1 Tax=Thermomonas sp. TaxID=1971895 RepID=UPI00263167EF|nr:hypothetical protein [Thermomonas sp.]